MAIHTYHTRNPTALLHIILGLGNDVLDRFWKNWFDKRVEPLTQEETEARHMTMCAEVVLEDCEKEKEGIQNDSDECMNLLLNINGTLTTGLVEDGTKVRLLAEKDRLWSQIKIFQTKMKSLEQTLKITRQAKKSAYSHEMKLRKQRGKLEKPMRLTIANEILLKHNIRMSHYRGGKMEGPSTRRFMHDGIEIFQVIASL